MLSFVRTLATFVWKRFICLLDTAAPSWSTDVRDVEARVPDVDVAHLREARHRFAVLTHRRHHDRAADRLVEAAIPARDREARGEPLHVPLEWPRQRLVEVVDAEDEPPIGRGEDAEVGEVRVAAELSVQPGPRPIREVGRHQVGAAAEEGERRHEHAPVPDRAELRQTRLRLLLEEIDGVSAPRRRLPVGVRRARQLAARGLAPSSPLGRREVRHRLRPGRALARRCALVEDVRLGRSRARRMIRVELPDVRVHVLHRSFLIHATERRLWHGGSTTVALLVVTRSRRSRGTASR